jgi:signal peptidase I
VTKNHFAVSMTTTLKKLKDARRQKKSKEDDKLFGMEKRQVVIQGMNFLLIVTSALMIWKCLMVLSGSESPIVVVLSGSMEPAFKRGDLLFLIQDEGPFEVGDVVVFKVCKSTQSLFFFGGGGGKFTNR